MDLTKAEQQTPGLVDQIIGVLPPDMEVTQLLTAVRSPMFQDLAGKLWDVFSSSVEATDPGTGSTGAVRAGVGRLAKDWADSLEVSRANELLSPAVERWYSLRDSLMRGMHPGWSDEEKQKKLTNTPKWHYERGLANALMSRETKALKTASEWLSRHVAIGRTPRRRSGAYADIANEIYRAASEMEKASPWRGLGGADQNTTAMLHILESGAMRGVLTRPGMFDMRGRITDEGKAEVRRILESAGTGMKALQSMTGKNMKALDIIRGYGRPDMLGSDFFGQLGDPHIANSLNAYSKMAKVSGLSPEASMGMLKRMRKFMGSRDIRPALNYGLQLMSLNAVAEDYLGGVAGDPVKRQQLAVMAIDRARRDPSMKIASAAAAALEPEYGRSASWGIVDDALKRAKSPAQLVGVLNGWLPQGRKLNRTSLYSLLNTPEAYEYFASGRPAGLSVYRAVAPTAQFLKKRSPFLGKYADRIMREKGRVDLTNVSQWLQENGASPEVRGRILGQLRGLGQDAAKHLRYPGQLSADDVLGFVSAGSMYRKRAGMLKSAGDYGRFASELAGKHADRGLEAGKQALAGGQAGVLGALGAALKGSDKQITAPDGWPAPSPSPLPGLTAGQTPGENTN